jgi:hypothetical protein
MYTGLKRIRLACPLAARNKMIDGITKMKKDEKEGRGYYSGRRFKEEDLEGEQPARKMERVNNSLTREQQEGCKCGAQDHQQVTLKNCPWKGLSKKEIFDNYEKAMKHVKAVKAATAATGCTEPTKDLYSPLVSFWRQCKPERLQHQILE